MQKNMMMRPNDEELEAFEYLSSPSTTLVRAPACNPLQSALVRSESELLNKTTCTELLQTATCNEHQHAFNWSSIAGYGSPLSCST
jgi:hypothetical protein